jgi:hypothetical protein
MATVKKMKKAQSGDSTSKKDPDIKSWMGAFNKQSTAEYLNPKLATERRRKEDSTMVSNWRKQNEALKDFHRKEGDLVEVRPGGSTSITIKRKKKDDGFRNGGKAKNGKWMQKVSKSIKKRGTEGKCTPITKPGCTGRAKALAKTFKKIAAKRKAK